MMYIKLLFLTVSFILSFTSALLQEKDHEAHFRNYMVEFGKEYKTKEEHETRSKIFHENLQKYAALNEEEKRNGGTAFHGPTKFSDMSEEEMKYYFGYIPKASNAKYKALNLRKASTNTIKDWTGILTTPIKNQGSCGSCWAFSAAEQIESDAMRTISGWGMVKLSPQQINSCDYSDWGCNGGFTESAFTYVKNNGITTEAAYPYVSGSNGVTGSCTYNPTSSVIGLRAYYTLATSGLSNSKIESDMKDYVLNTGPLSICIAASSWSGYTNGVKTTCDTSINHCVQIVGINTVATIPYWIIRNQWGTNWGMSGYMYLKYGINLCMLTDDPIYTDVYKIEGAPTAAPVVPIAPPTKAPTSCTGGTLSWYGDGYCDSINNNAACNWDGGDCCKQSCVNGDYTCGFNGYNCLDPAYTTVSPSKAPVSPVSAPTKTPSMVPSMKPSRIPTPVPSFKPTPTRNPSRTPSLAPLRPSSSRYPTRKPTSLYTAQPSSSPTATPTVTPSSSPSVIPTATPSAVPSSQPSSNPTIEPTATPTALPTSEPTAEPTVEPTPTLEPTIECVVPNTAFLGDGYCDDGVYNTRSCNFDGGDCCETTCVDGSANPCGINGYVCVDPRVASKDPCPVAGSPFLGDGYCHVGVYNTKACGYDGGDCCQSSCTTGRTYTCGSNTHLTDGFECLDPSS